VTPSESVPDLFVPAWEPNLPLRPDLLPAFRLGRLLLLLDIAAGTSRPSVGLDRVGYYDFFADAPLLVFEPGTAEHRWLKLAGFNSRNLSYTSAAQRFTNRRARLQHDLAWLLARDLMALNGESSKPTWAATTAGRELAASLRSMYAIAFRESAELVIRKLGKLSDMALDREARAWLRAEAFLVDLGDPSEVLE
jgi:hypothetical protein